MIDDTKALVIIDAEIVSYEEAPGYADDLARAGMVADRIGHEDAFKVYHQTITDNSREAQLDALKLFSEYLAKAGVARSVDDLFTDAQAWRGMSEGLAKGFRAWLVNAGYRIGSINHRLAIIRQYCRLAHKAQVLPDEAYNLIMTVKGFSAKIGRNLDKDREREGQKTTLSTKKAIPANVRKGQAQRLKTATTRPARGHSREHDKLLEARDALLMGLLIEHAFRVSEVVGLDVESFDLQEATVTVYRSKTHDINQHKLHKHSLLAAERYLSMLDRKRGPLFTSYQGKRITRQGIFDRVRLLGQQVGIDNLSPHDLRHYWTYDALENGTPLDRVQSGGNWTTPTMVLRYAKRAGIANEGVIISE